MKKHIAIVISVLLWCSCSYAGLLTSEELKYNLQACKEGQYASQNNQGISKNLLDKYCVCYVNKIDESLTKKDLERLYQSARMKIVGSYNVGGASIRHYSDIENKKGEFEFKMEIYGKKTTPDGKKVIAEKIGGDGQTTYWCPDVQISL